MTPRTLLTDLARDYRVAFLRHLGGPDEAARHRGYVLGRTAIGAGVSLLDLARVHHDTLIEVLADTPREETAAVATAASAFFLEVLATYDMAQPDYQRPRPGRALT